MQLRRLIATNGTGILPVLSARTINATERPIWGSRWIGRAFALCLMTKSVVCFAQGTAFTYQGRLNDGLYPASGDYDLRFALFDADAGGTQQGAALFRAPTEVVNGLFAVALDFGNQFPGAARWIEIAVRPTGGGAYEVLAPRQAISAAPYAIAAGQFTGTLPNAGLSGAYGNAVTVNNPANVFAGSFSGDGGSLTNVAASTLDGISSASFWQIGGK